MQSQAENKLEGEINIFHQIDAARELGRIWVVLNYSKYLLDGNFNLDLARKLRNGDTLFKVRGLVEFEDEGSNLVKPIAALFFENELLYKSPGFNLGDFQKDQIVVRDVRSVKALDRKKRNVNLARRESRGLIFEYEPTYLEGAEPAQPPGDEWRRGW